MLQDLQKKMYGLSGGIPVQYTIPEGHVDDVSSTARGRSWLDSCHTEPRDQGLMHLMVRQGLWNMCRVNGKGSLEWNRVACETFMQQAADIVDLIITLVHVGCGPPVRGEEIIRDQITNGIQPRTIYLMFGQLIAIRRHSKDTHARGIDPFNVCYFPQSLTKAICYYLLVIRPLEKLVAWQLYQDTKKCQNYDLFLYVKYGERMTSSDFSTVLGKLTHSFIGVSLTLQPLRHIMIAFQRAYVLESRAHHRGNNIGDLLSSHTSETADNLYARDRDTPGGMTESYLLDVQEWCEEYHDAIGLGERTGPLISIRTKRRIARGLASIGSADPRDTSTSGAISAILKELTTDIYRSVLHDLKQHLTQEVWESVGKGLEQITSDRDLFQDTSPTSPTNPDLIPISKQPLHHHPPSLTPTPINVPIAPSKNVPTQTQLGIGYRKPVKRQLSRKDEPAPKRKLPTTTHIKRDPKPPESDSDDDGLQYASDHSEHAFAHPEPTFAHPEPASDHPEPASDHPEPAFAHPEPTSDHPKPASDHPEPTSNHPEPTPDTVSNTHHRRILPLPPSKAQKIQEQAALLGLSTMTLEHQPQADRPKISSTTGHNPTSITENPPPDDDLLKRLRRYRADPSAEFKSTHQRQLLESTANGAYTLAVLPTGGGKSIAYEVPPSYKDKITIVAFPYRVIMSQAFENAKRHGLSAEVWTVHTKRHLGARLVIMAIETLLTESMIE